MHFRYIPTKFPFFFNPMIHFVCQSREINVVIIILTCYVIVVESFSAFFLKFVAVRGAETASLRLVRQSGHDASQVVSLGHTVTDIITSSRRNDDIFSCVIT